MLLTDGSNSITTEVPIYIAPRDPAAAPRDPAMVPRDPVIVPHDPATPTDDDDNNISDVYDDLDIINDVIDIENDDDGRFPEFDYDISRYTRLSDDVGRKYSRYDDDVLPNDEASMRDSRYTRRRTTIVDKLKPHNDVLAHDKQGKTTWSSHDQ